MIHNFSYQCAIVDAIPSWRRWCFRPGRDDAAGEGRFLIVIMYDLHNNNIIMLTYILRWQTRT